MAVGSPVTNPNIIPLTPAYFPGLGSQRVRIKYGPYTVPPSSMFNIRERKAFKPCEDCLITFMQADLEFPNGSYANADLGMWLHHVVQVDSAVDDTVCGKNVTKRRMAPNRFFASGNERSAVHLSAQGYAQISSNGPDTINSCSTTALKRQATSSAKTQPSSQPRN
jgi:hypothetical protein